VARRRPGPPWKQTAVGDQARVQAARIAAARRRSRARRATALTEASSRAAAHGGRGPRSEAPSRPARRTSSWRPCAPPRSAPRSASWS
jgi:hypothetical protein